MSRLLSLALRYAWRDGRGGLRRLALSAATVIVGVAALVAIRSFALDIDSAVAAETKSLLGADLEIGSQRPFTPEAETLLASLGGEQAREVALGSMAYFPVEGGSRLVRVRAVDPGYPFYGELETVPADGGERLHEGDHALVDRTLMLQMGVAPGDRVRIGELELTIVGAILRLPGEVPTGSLVGPRVLIPRSRVDRTGLIRPGSRVRYSVQFRLDEPPEVVASRVDELRPQLRRLRLDAESVVSRRRWVGRALGDLKTFLALAAIAALLLGAVGTASAATVHARRHRESVAVLRCLGAEARLPLAAHAAQALGMAAVGSAAGVVVGLGIQRLLPAVVGPFLPLPVRVALRPAALAEAGAVGLGVALVFGVGPLLPLRRVRPLAALRADLTAESGSDPLVRLLPGLLALLATVIAWRQTGSWQLGAGVVVGLGATLALLALVAIALRRVARRLLRSGGRWEWRQGVSNLHRPQNQTLVMTLGIGTGVFLVATLALLGRGLLASIAGMEVAGGADMVLFDVQPDQRDGVRDLLERAGVGVLEEVPVVPMRLALHRGRPVADVDDEEVSSWSLRREYNSTYRETLSDTEELLEGDWVGSFDPQVGDRVPISLSEEIARALDLGVGGELTFDVQGVSVPVRVASIRSVDWRQVRPNFLVVFPRGVLEPAPQQIVFVARAGEEAVSATAQRSVVRAFPNVSVLDMALVLRTVDEVLDRVRFALRFLAGFVVLAGIAILVVATLEGRSERQREGVLLRTLGASRRQIARIGFAEYLVLGSIAAVSGLSLALAASWLLLHRVFDASLEPAPGALGGILLATLWITAGLGFWNGRAMSRRSAMELLRRS